MRTVRFLCVMFLLSLNVPLSAQVPLAPVLDQSSVQRMMGSAESLAEAEGWRVVIAIVDEGGYLWYLKRMEGALLPSVEVAIQKAKAAALYRQPTRSFQEAILQGNTTFLGLPEVLPIGGGLPVVRNGRVVGGIGVSGGTISQAEQAAQAGLNALPG